ncbi:MAG: AMP-binding protein [Oscillospiraceae bacterium]|nr:AMP-binding protein [Oscillospiraceae bacterium]
MTDTNSTARLIEIAQRICDMREICDFSVLEMAQKTGVSVEEYKLYEAGQADMPFSFLHKCALAFGIELTDLMEGHSANLTSYTLTRQGRGVTTAREKGIEIQNLAPFFRKKLAEPYWVEYEYLPELENQPIATQTHAGQEFDLVIKGQLKVQVGDHIEVLNEGDSIYYNSSAPHGMIAVGGTNCRFLAIVMASDEAPQKTLVRREHIEKSSTKNLVCSNFIKTVEDKDGNLVQIDFENTDSFNFSYDIVDAIAEKSPDKTALIHISRDGTERIFSYKQIHKEVCRTANYFESLGIKRGDKVMLVLKRHYQFWFSILALHRIGAVAIPATNQLVAHDFEYRFNAAHVSAIVCTADGDTADEVEKALPMCPSVTNLIIANGSREGWHNFDDEQPRFSSHYDRPAYAPGGEEPMLMFFTSGTTGYPKIATHSFTYPLGHYVTAKYWHCVSKNGPHFTISETGWGKALWGKLYGQWLCEGSVFVYDFDKFDAAEILPMFAKYNIATFCAPPTMYRMLIKQDLSKYDLSSIKHATTAGEAMNPEVFRQFQAATGLQLMEGFGQTEMTLGIASLAGMEPKPGSMGKPTPLYDISLMMPDGSEAPIGETGEIVIRTDDHKPCGLFLGYFEDEEKTSDVWHDGYYHTGDLAWRDEDGYYWYVGRSDDVIKSSGYRIGPFEIENVIMELPYVLECGVSAEPDEVRGQIVKASIVLTKGTEGTEELKKEIQEYVKTHTAPYKYPRKIVFRDELPKTISGKIMHNKL